MANFPQIPVYIEDYTESLPPLESGRGIFSVFVSDRGRHNEVVTWTSVPMFIKLFGRPNFEKYGTQHNTIVNSTRFSARNFGIRASLVDSTTETNNAAIANAAIKYNLPDGSEEQLFGKFIFTNDTDALSEFANEFISRMVIVDRIGFEQFKLNTYIYSDSDDNSKALKIIERGTIIADQAYYLKLSDFYQGTSTVDEDNGNNLLVTFTNILNDNDKENIENYTPSINNPFVELEAYKYYKGVEIIIGSSFIFTENSVTVVCSDESSFDSIGVEEWIYPSRLNSTFAKQVIKKQIGPTNDYELIIDSVFVGTDSPSPETIKSYVPIEIVSDINIRTHKSIDIQDSDNIFHVVGLGTGSYYNNIYLKGVRNIEMENYWLDDDTATFPEPLYKYAFLEIGIYERRADGSSVLLEGPWLTSLINKASATNDANSDIIRDPETGRSMYLPTVVNENSDFIRVYEANGVDLLEGTSESAEKLRIQLMSLFSEGTILDSNIKGKEGFFLENGEDGILFDSRGRYNKYNTEIVGSIRRCYEGTMASADNQNSIQKVVEEIYPRYVFDYVLAGGYDKSIQKAAADLAWKRGSMLALLDTGHNLNAQEDLNARHNDTPFNHWSAALYTQYRKIDDPYTGKKMWITPVYHAIEAHLKVDTEYWIGEPVMMNLKGAITESMELAYDPSNDEMKDMIRAQLNPTINDLSENGGKYFIQNITTYKRLSRLQYLYVVKPLMYVKQRIQPLLKEFLGLKGSPYNVGRVRKKVNAFLTPYIAERGRYRLFKSFDSFVYMDDIRNQLYVTIEFKFDGLIEQIPVTIRVVD